MDRSFRPCHAAFTLASLLAAALTLTPLAARAQPVALKITASDAHRDDYFGSSVAVSGDVAVVGAPGDDDNGLSSGAAYVLRRVGAAWVEEAKLTASDGSADDLFGSSVSVSGDVAVVGAYEDDAPFTSSGSAYVFRYDGASWVEEQKLTAADGSFHDLFGTSVAVAGGIAFVGAPGDNIESGSVYLFRYDGASWVEEERLTASDVSARGRFGVSVAVAGDAAVVGADRSLGSGSAYVFRYDGVSWAEEQKLTPSGGSASHFFGASVAVSGDVAVVSASGEDSSSGAAYVFRRVGRAWAEEQRLTASDGATADFFGYSVAVAGDVMVVGAFGDDDHDFNSGSAYVFRYDGTSWVEEQKLTAADASGGDFFGSSVAVAGDVALVGAYGDDDRGPFSGSAYAVYLEAAPVTLAPLSPPVVLPPAGGAFDYAAFVPNNAASPYPFDAWVTATLPDGSPYGPVAGPVHATLPAHVAVARTLRLRVPASAPPGTYTLTLNVGDYPDVVDALASFTFEKEAGEAATRGAPFALVSEGVLFAEAAPAAVVPAAGAIAATASLAASPNPSAGRTLLRYDLAEAAAVRLAVYDVLGREVAVLADAAHEAGAHEASFDATGLPSGAYLVRLTAGDRVLTRRVTVLR